MLLPLCGFAGTSFSRKAAKINPDYAIGAFILFFFLCVLCGFA